MQRATGTQFYYKMGPFVSHRQDAHCVTKTVGLTPTISVLCDQMLPTHHSALQLNGHFLTDLPSEDKTAEGDLLAPSNRMGYECYREQFKRVLGKTGRAFMIVDGDRGREHLMRYMKERKARAAPLSQETINELDLSVLDFDLDVLATGGGAIFELYIDGGMTLVILRPSTGSFAYYNYRDGGRRSLLEVMRPLHNQMVVLAAMMGFKIPIFRSDTSPLALIFDKASAADITSLLRSKGLIGDDVVYRTPQQNGGHASGGGKMTVAGAGLFSERLGRITLTMKQRSVIGNSTMREARGAIDNDSATAAQKSMIWRNDSKSNSLKPGTAAHDSMLQESTKAVGASNKRKLTSTLAKALLREQQEQQ